jgi:DNA-binding HxlR family transcriptional regulator
MKKKQRRSNCPISFALESFGDSWSLLIVRDIAYFGKKTYGEFLDSDEGIATNILASRLAQLEESGILHKQTLETDRRKEIYSLTEKGLDLIPILMAFGTWSAKHDPQTGAPPQWIAYVNSHRDKVLRLARETVRNGGAIFVGPGSVISQVADEMMALYNKNEAAS